MRRQTLLALLMVGFCARANADVLCKKPNGALSVRTQCKGKEVQLDPAALGLQGPAGPPGPPATSLAVYDANGAEVGKVIGTLREGPLGQLEAVITLKIDEYVFALFAYTPQLAGDDYADFPPNGLVFESSDCSGTPFILNQPSQLLPRAVVALPGNTVYLPDPHGISLPTISYRSALRGAIGIHPPQTCVGFGSPQGYGSVVSALPIIDLDTLFTPPFSVR